MAYLLIVEKTGFKNDECGAVEEFEGRKKKKKKPATLSGFSL